MAQMNRSNNRIVWMEDGQKLSTCPSSFSDIAKSQKWVSGNPDDPRLDFCGFVRYLENNFFVLPKTTFRETKSDFERISDARVVFQSISLFAQQYSKGIYGEKLTPFEEDDLSQILLMRNLIDDWSRFGIYRQNTFKDQIGNKGKVLWEKTVAGIVPYIHRNTPIYLQTILRSQQQTLDQIISAIHMWAVAKADHTVGWLYANNNKYTLFNSLSDVSEDLPIEPFRAISILNQRLNQTFDSRNINLLKMLIKMVQGHHHPLGELQVLGTRAFWRIWQHMCFMKIADNSTHTMLIERMPKPVYRFTDNSTSEPISKQLPDILNQLNSGTIEIYDAKYYDIKFTKPSWADIVKQIFYAETIRAAEVGSNTRSVFLFPETSIKNRPTEIVVEDIRRSALGMEPIECEYVNMINLCREYITLNKVRSLSVTS